MKLYLSSLRKPDWKCCEIMTQLKNLFWFKNKYTMNVGGIR